MKKKFFLTLTVLTTLLGCSAHRIPVADSAPAVDHFEMASPEAQAIFAYLASRQLLSDQRPNDAATALDTALTIDPSPALYLELGNLYWRNSKFDDAVRTLRQGIATYPESEVLHVALAKGYAAQGKFDEAVAVLDAYGAKGTATPNLIHQTATLRLEQGNYADALTRLQQIPESKATAMTYFLQGKAHSGLDEQDKAIADYTRAIVREPDFFDASVELALLYDARSEYAKAERIFAGLHDAGVNSQMVFYHLVDLNLKLDEPDKALEFARAIPGDQALMLESANLFLNRNYADYATELLEPLAKADPVPVDALYTLAVLAYETRNDTDGALKYLEAIPAGHAHYERSLVFRIHLLHDRGDLAQAQAVCETGITTYPRQPEFQILLAEILDKQGKGADAVQILEQATTTWPEDEELFFRLGIFYDRLSQRDKAMQIMENVIRLKPDHDGALNFLGYTLAEKNQHLDRAEQLVLAALKVEPDNGYYVDSLAWIYFRQGKINRAWREIQRAVFLTPKDAVIWEHHGDIALAKKFTATARKSYTRSLQLDGDNADSVRAKLRMLEQQP